MVYNRTPREFINWCLFIKFKGLLCGNPTERAERLILNLWPPGSLYVQPRHRECLPQVRGFRTRKKYNTSNVYTVKMTFRAVDDQKRSGDPNSQYFYKCAAVQMGGVLLYKWEAYCSTNGRRIAGFPLLRSLEARKARRYKWGGVLPSGPKRGCLNVGA